ncbi:AAA family ATPase [Phaeobacter sp. 22II1-1F12B]|uniref:AAA family ATPase n=1 Tax=Phaeobacter sp. 22II1-1F12B TaxID=1317111 RepID=UPI000B51FF0B|nr:AAA family ATPase [Phaeobacter sp. 22II1-1F12B]OWU82672.1 hypothetical protein ATO1_01870 [Phaeobacter sp. 22II1-1F12B]
MNNPFISEFEIFGCKAQHTPSFKPDLNPPYAVKDFLQIGENSVLYGAPGLGKTAIVAAIAAHASIGRDFGDCLTQKSVVIVFAAEDRNGVHKRAYPYLNLPEFSTAPFYVVPKGFDMLDHTKVEEVKKFIRAVQKAHGILQAVVIFDTLNRMLGQHDENSSTVIGSYFSNAEDIAQSTNSACLTIHHSGKGTSAGARGSSAIVGNADNIYRLTNSKQDKSLVHIVPEKTKDIDSAKSLSFRIEPHNVGVDRDGAVKTFPKAIPQGSTGIDANIPANENKPPKRAGGERIEDVGRILIDETKFGNGHWLSPPQIAERTGEAFRDVRSNRDSHLKAVKRSLKALKENGSIREGDGKFKIADECLESGQV